MNAAVAGVDQQAVAGAADWLNAFASALVRGDEGAVAACFVEDSHWRDLLAFEWRLRTTSGAARIARRMHSAVVRAAPRGFLLAPGRTPPRRVERIGRNVIEAILAFDTAVGPAEGVIRLVDDGGRLKAWTLLTALDQIRGHEESIDAYRPRGEAYSRDFHGPNWLDRRTAARAFDDREPTVLVIGGGHAGLSIAARLTQLGVDTLVIDREARIGDNWRHRYHALTLHNQVHVNHLPYLSFPPTWPTYIPKDKIANWLELYVEALDLNFWTRTAFTGATYDAADARWTATLDREGVTRTIRPRHIVMATGVSGVPMRPAIPTLDAFRGPVRHSSEFGDSHAWAGRDVLIIGTGTSGHDIAQDLYSNGGRPTLVQRSPVSVFSIEPSGQLPYTLYSEGPPLADCDLIAAATPLAPLRDAHRRMTAQAREIDRPLLEALKARGFQLDEIDETGWLFKYIERGGGYYFNVGCSDLIASGAVPLLPAAEIDTFTSDGVRLRDGSERRADLIVLATGYHGPTRMARELFGAAIADRVGPIWGFSADDQEIRNLWGRTRQPGLWFQAGSFAQCRIYSKFLAMQIKAVELGLTGPQADEE